MARTKHVFRTDEVAHKWASQTMDWGKNPHGNLFFWGDTIYSYRDSFPIAKFVKPGVTLHNPNRYSVTTAVHECLAWQAVSHTKRFKVPYLDSLSRNVKYLEQQIIQAIETLKKSRSCIDSQLENIRDRKEILNEYTKEFHVGRDVARKWNRKTYVIPPDQLAKLRATAEKVEKGNVKRRETIRANRIKENAMRHLVHDAERIWQDEIDALTLEAWKQGDTKHRLGYDAPYAIRLEGDEIVTTHDARVPVSDALALWDKIKAKEDIKGLRVGSYEVSGIHDGKLIVGCHEIPVVELVRMAKLLGKGE